MAPFEVLLLGGRQIQSRVGFLLRAIADCSRSSARRLPAVSPFSFGRLRRPPRSRTGLEGRWALVHRDTAPRRTMGSRPRCAHGHGWATRRLPAVSTDRLTCGTPDASVSLRVRRGRTQRMSERVQAAVQSTFAATVPTQPYGSRCPRPLDPPAGNFGNFHWTARGIPQPKKRCS